MGRVSENQAESPNALLQCHGSRSVGSFTKKISTAESTSPWNSTNLAICYIYEFARLKNAEEGREKGRFIYALEDRKGQVSLLTEGCSPKAEIYIRYRSRSNKNPDIKRSDDRPEGGQLPLHTRRRPVVWANAVVSKSTGSFLLVYWWAV